MTTWFLCVHNFRTKHFLNVLYAIQSLVQGCDQKEIEKPEELRKWNPTKNYPPLLGFFCFILFWVCIIQHTVLHRIDHSFFSLASDCMIRWVHLFRVWENNIYDNICGFVLSISNSLMFIVLIFLIKTTRRSSSQSLEAPLCMVTKQGRNSCVSCPQSPTFGPSIFTQRAPVSSFCFSSSFGQEELWKGIVPEVQGCGTLPWHVLYPPGHPGTVLSISLYFSAKKKVWLVSEREKDWERERDGQMDRRSCTLLFSRRRNEVRISSTEHSKYAFWNLTI